MVDFSWWQEWRAWGECYRRGTERFPVGRVRSKVGVRGNGLLTPKAGRALEPGGTLRLSGKAAEGQGQWTLP